MGIVATDGGEIKARLYIVLPWWVPTPALATCDLDDAATILNGTGGCNSYRTT